MKNAIARYVADAKADLQTFVLATTRPVSQPKVAGVAGAAAIGAMFFNIGIAYAATTPLFSRLASALSVLLNDMQDMVLTLATFALVLCILGIMIAPIFGSKATATMFSALKAVICAYLFFQLMPAFLDTITQVFGTGTGSGGGSGSGTGQA
mgnify:FL=1